MLVGNSRLLKTCNNIQLSILNRILERVTSFKYLGLFIDEFLSWKIHIHHLINKVSCRLGVLRRVLQYLTADVTALLFNAMVQPLFDYCDTVWSSAINSDLSRLQKLQNRAARIILCVKIREYHVPELLSKLNWNSLEYRRNQHICTMVFRCISGHVLAYLSHLFDKNMAVHNYNTRQSDHLHFHRASTSKDIKSFRHRGTKQYNNLPSNVRSAPTLSIFKTKILQPF
jgi:hypothetical protein